MCIRDREINDSVRVGDIQLPEGVRTEVDLEETVAVGTVTRSTMESMAAEEAAELELELEEGEDSEVEGDGSEEDQETSAEDSE